MQEPWKGRYKSSNHHASIMSDPSPCTSFYVIKKPNKTPPGQRNEKNRNLSPEGKSSSVFQSFRNALVSADCHLVQSKHLRWTTKKIDIFDSSSFKPNQLWLSNEGSTQSHTEKMESQFCNANIKGGWYILLIHLYVPIPFL